jgi:hypothetical protein
MIFFYHPSIQCLSKLNGGAKSLIAVSALGSHYSHNDILVLPDNLLLDFSFRRNLKSYFNSWKLQILSFTSFASLYLSKNYFTFSENEKVTFMHIDLSEIETITFSIKMGNIFPENYIKTNSLIHLIKTRNEKPLTFSELSALYQGYEKLKNFIDRGNALDDSLKVAYLEAPVDIPDFPFLKGLKVGELITFQDDKKREISAIVAGTREKSVITGFFSSFFEQSHIEPTIEISPDISHSLNLSGFNINFNYEISFDEGRPSSFLPLFVQDNASGESLLVKELESDYLGNTLVFTEKANFKLEKNKG